MLMRLPPKLKPWIRSVLAQPIWSSRSAVCRNRRRTNLVMSELKAEAVRAGMVDLDGLKLLDTSTVTVGERGDVTGAASHDGALP